MKNAFKRASLPGQDIAKGFSKSPTTPVTRKASQRTQKNNDKTARVKFKPNETEPIDTKRAISGPAKKDEKKTFSSQIIVMAVKILCGGALRWKSRRPFKIRLMFMDMVAVDCLLV